MTTPADIAAALALRCPICCARVGENCAFLTDASKYMPIPHAGRLSLARAVKENQHA